MMTPHSVGQDNQNDMQLYIIGHVMPLALALASSDADGVINSIIVFIRS